MRSFRLTASAVLLAGIAWAALSVPLWVRAQSQAPTHPPQAVLPQKTSPALQGPSGGTVRTPRQDEELRGDLFMARKQYAEAAGTYQQLLQQEPRNAVLLNKLGIAFHQQSRLDRAKHFYERATKADRSYAYAYNNIGMVYYQQRNYRKAIQLYKKALVLRPEMAAFYSNLGYAYFGKKEYDEAMAAFHRALELDPSVFDRSHNMGTTLQDRSVDDHGLFYFFLAKSYASMGNAERCAHYLRKAWDEGYKGVTGVPRNPAFAGVLQDPDVQRVLQMVSASDTRPAVAPAPPGS